MNMFVKRVLKHKITDCGTKGKVFEPLVKWGLQGSGRVASAGEVDAFIRTHALELKTGGGEIAVLSDAEYIGYSDKSRQSAIVAKAIKRQMAKVEFVLYCTNPDFNRPRAEILESAWILTVEEFITLMVNGGAYTTPTGRAGKAKLHKRNRATNGGYRLNIQVNGIDMDQVLENAGAMSYQAWRKQA